MNQQKWTEVDEYITNNLVKANPALEKAVQLSLEAGLPAIQVSQPQGKMLWQLAKLMGAKNILEIGTLGGYSTIWMAQALPADGKLVTLEIDARHADVARINIESAGFAKNVEVIVGNAISTLPQLSDQKPFDMVFIDADKAATLEYFEWAVKLSRSGSLIVVDNVIRGGEVSDSQSKNSGVRGIRRFFEKIKSDTRVDATAIQTVGNKGYDGFSLAIVR